MTPIYICANLFNVWLNRKERDVLTCCFISPLTTYHFHRTEPSSQDSLRLGRERKTSLVPQHVLRDRPPEFQERPLGTAELQSSFITLNRPPESRAAITGFAKNGDEGTEMLGHHAKVTQLRRSRAETQSHIHLSESLSD